MERKLIEETEKRRTGKVTMAGGVELSDGTKIESSKDIPNLKPGQLQELAEMHVTMLQYFQLKKEKHEYLNEVQKIYDLFEEIQSSLTIKVKNGGEREVALSRLILEMYEREKARRLWEGVKSFLDHNKKGIILVVILGMTFIFAFRDHVAELVTFLYKLVISILQLS